MSRYTDEERATVLAAGRQAIADAEASLADGYVSPVPWPAEDRVQRVARERAAERVRTAAPHPLTEWEAARLEHRLAGLVDEQKQLVFGVLAEIVAEFEAKIAALSDEFGQLRADANIEKAHRVLDLPKLPLRKTA
jgi:hypothetical protein